MGVPMLQDPMMRGINLPPRLAAGGKPKPHEVEPWYEVVETLMGRGIQSTHRIAKLTGVAYASAKRWMGVVEARWAEGLDRERLNIRREVLYSEADGIAAQAFKDALDMTHEPKERAAFMRVVLEANRRKAALNGLDSQTLQVVSNRTVNANVNIVAKVEADMGLKSGALGNIGRDAAILLSGRELEALPGTSKVIEAESKDVSEDTTEEPERRRFEGMADVPAQITSLLSDKLHYVNSCIE